MRSSRKPLLLLVLTLVLTAATAPPVHAARRAGDPERVMLPFRELREWRDGLVASVLRWFDELRGTMDPNGRD